MTAAEATGGTNPMPTSTTNRLGTVRLSGKSEDCSSSGDHQSDKLRGKLPSLPNNTDSQRGVPSCLTPTVDWRSPRLDYLSRVIRICNTASQSRLSILARIDIPDTTDYTERPVLFRSPAIIRQLRGKARRQLGTARTSSHQTQPLGERSLSA